MTKFRSWIPSPAPVGGRSQCAVSNKVLFKGSALVGAGPACQCKFNTSRQTIMRVRDGPLSAGKGRQCNTAGSVKKEQLSPVWASYETKTVRRAMECPIVIEKTTKNFVAYVPDLPGIVGVSTPAVHAAAVRARSSVANGCLMRSASSR